MRKEISQRDILFFDLNLIRITKNIKNELKQFKNQEPFDCRYYKI